MVIALGQGFRYKTWIVLDIVHDVLENTTRLLIEYDWISMQQVLAVRSGRTEQTSGREMLGLCDPEDEGRSRQNCDKRW